MSVKRWLSRARRIKHAARNSFLPAQIGPGRRRRLWIELLEDRSLLAADVFINPNGGDWFVATNWSLGQVPSSQDDVSIPALSSGNAVTYVLGTGRSAAVLHSLDVDGQLTISGLLTVPGQVSGGGSVTLVNDFNGHAGELADADVVSAMTIVGSGGSLNDVTLNGNASILNGTDTAFPQSLAATALTVNGALSLQGSVEFSGAQTLDGSGTIAFSGAGGLALDPNATLTLGPQLTLTGNQISIAGTGTFSNGSTSDNSTLIVQGTIECNGDSSLINLLSLQVFIDTSGRLIVGTVSSASQLDVSANVAVTDTLTNSGLISMGSNTVISVGIAAGFKPQNGFIQTATGTLSLEIDDPPENGRLGYFISTHQAQLSGTLVASLGNGFQLAGGQSYDIFNPVDHTVSGSFSTFTGTGLSLGYNYVLTPTTPALLPDIDMIDAFYSLAGMDVNFNYIVSGTPLPRTIQGKPKPFVVGLYQSASPTFDASATLLASTTVTNYSGNSAGFGSFNLLQLSSPFGFDPAHPYLLVVADPPNDITEFNEGNNVASAIASPPYTPAQIRAAYGVDKIPAFAGHTADGSGQTIAIVVAYHDPNIAADLTSFDTQFGLSPPPGGLDVVAEDGSLNYPGTDPGDSLHSPGGWEGEESLDVEWAHAIAPGARILVVECQPADLLQGVSYAASHGASIVSMSWTAKNSATGLPYEPPQETSLDSTFTVPGVTFVGATGDYGPPGGYPAYSPNVLAVGGTSLQLGSAYSLSGALETAWSGSGGGVSTQEKNDAPFQRGVTIHNGFTQTINANGYRTIPDVSFDSDPNTGVYVYDSFNASRNNNDPWTVVGGTSLGAPCWAGLIAIVDQGRAAASHALPPLSGSTQTLAAIYETYKAAPNDFNDIANGRSVTSGTNVGYSAGPGYDLVTGLGTPKANLLVPALAAWDFSLSGSPADGSVGAAYQQAITGIGGVGAVTFTSSVSAGSIPPGLAITSVNNELEISGTPTAAGTFTLDLKATDSLGAVVEQTYTITIHPAVVDVRVAWGSQSMSLLNLNRDLPFVDIDAIDVFFSDDVQVSEADLILAGKAVPSYAFSSFAYSPPLHEAIWLLRSPLGADRLELIIDGTSAMGVHTQNPAIPMLADFTLSFDVLPGDFTGDGKVTSSDMMGVYAVVRSGDYNVFADVNGDGSVGLAAVQTVRSQIGKVLP